MKSEKSKRKMNDWIMKKKKNISDEKSRKRKN